MSVKTGEKYDPKIIEAQWATKWEEDGLYRAVIDKSKPKHYALTMYPYPSGNLHIGHWYAMAPSDARARYMRMKGYNVLFPMGFDSFGLPAENAAIKRNIHPQKWTYANIDKMRQQLRSMGAMFDWEREAITSDPEYYRWSQWFFLKLYENGLAYRKKAAVDFCPQCNTTLAREQVWGDDRHCERCGTPVIKKDLEQWFFSITDYSDELLNFEGINWPERVRTMQTNWIGKSSGAEVIFRTETGNHEIKIFTTRPDTLWGATFMVLAPEHPLVDIVTTDDRRAEVDAYIETATRKTEIERTGEGKEKTGVFTGGYAINPVNDEKIPIWIADYVMISYGTGAIMAVPAHDQRDFEFARKFGLEIRVVIQPDGETLDSETMPEAWAGEGKMVNSGKFNGSVCNEEKGLDNPAIKAVSEWLDAEGLGKATVTYRLHDWLISRQRYWGAPIPMIYCEKCGTVPVPEKDLPVMLPDDVEFKDTGESPLRFHEGFLNVTCPSCGGKATRETDTMDTFMCSSWYQWRYMNPHYEEWAIDPEEGAYWLPVDQYTGGIEHATMHLLYTRFFTKALRDCGIFDPVIARLKEQGKSEAEINGRFDEPMLALFNQGMILGESRDGHIIIAEGETGSDAHLMARSIRITGSLENAPASSNGRVVGEVVKRTENLLNVRLADEREVTVEVTDETQINIPGTENATIDGIKYRLDIEKMSKSKGNVIDPDEQVALYGADTVRGFLMFAYRWEQGGPWDSQSIQGVVRWLNDVWTTVNAGVPEGSGTDDGKRDIIRKLHQTIDRVTSGMETFSFNTAVAGLMELKNSLREAIRGDKIDADTWQEVVRNMLIMMAPVTPFIAEELWARIGESYSVHNQSWPKFDPELAKEEEVTLVVQINGKVRDRIQVPADISEADAKATALASESVQKFLEGKEPRKMIFIANRHMMNIVK